MFTIAQLYTIKWRGFDPRPGQSGEVSFSSIALHRSTQEAAIGPSHVSETSSFYVSE